MVATIYDMNGTNPKYECFTTDPTEITKIFNHRIWGVQIISQQARWEYPHPGGNQLTQFWCNQLSGDQTCYPSIPQYHTFGRSIALGTHGRSNAPQNPNFLKRIQQIQNMSTQNRKKKHQPCFYNAGPPNYVFPY